VNEKISYESGIYADPDLFRIMTFPALSGEVVRSLESNSAIVITKDMAKKLLPTKNPLVKLSSLTCIIP